MLLKLISTRIIPYRTIPKALSFSFETVNKTDQIKKHQELNTKLKDYRDTHKFTLANPSQKAVKFISDSQKIKQIKEIKVLFEDFLQKGLDNLNEKQFIELITKISQSVTNEIVLKDPKFEIMIKKYAFKLSSFKDTRNACFFICFCSISNLNYPDIWDYFKSYLLNMQEKMSVESKCMILVNYMPINEKYFEIFFEIYEKEFEEKIKKEKLPLRATFEILYIYRRFDKASEQFYKTIEEFFEKNLSEISIDNLMMLLGYYSASTKEKRETIKKFLSLFENRLFQLCTFLNPQDILHALIAYIRTNMGSEELFYKLETRSLAIIDKFNVEELEKLITLISNSPRKQAIFLAIETQILTNIKVLKPYNYPGILYTFASYNLGSELFYSILTDRIISSVFLYTPEQISKLLWAYSVKKPNTKIFFNKAQEYIIENADKFVIGDIANIVWSFTEAKTGSNKLFLVLEEELVKRGIDLSIKDIAKVLWGYVNKLALNKKVLKGFFERILNDKGNEADAWDIAMILWAFSRLRTEEYDDIYVVLEKKTREICLEMNNYELVTSMRAYSEKKKVSKELLKVFLKKLEACGNSLNENEVVVAIHALISVEIEDLREETGKMVEFLWGKIENKDDLLKYLNSS